MLFCARRLQKDWQRAVDKEKVNAPLVMHLKVQFNVGKMLEARGSLIFLLLLLDSKIARHRVSLGISISVIYSVYNCNN